MKKSIAALMGATLVVSSMAAFAAPVPVDGVMPELYVDAELINEEIVEAVMPEIDLPMFHWATEDAEKVAELHLANMRLTKNFDEAMAAAEFTSAITTIFDLTEEEAEEVFADIEEETLTRIETAVVLAKAVEVKEILVAGTMMNPVFADIEEDYEFFGAISFVVNARLMNGDHEGNFNPDAELTYAEAVTVLSRAVDMVGFEADEEAIPVHLPEENEEAIPVHLPEITEDDDYADVEGVVPAE